MLPHHNEDYDKDLTAERTANIINKFLVNYIPVLYLDFFVVVEVYLFFIQNPE